MSYYNPELSAGQYAIERAICDKAQKAMEDTWPDWRNGGALPEAVTSHPDYIACDNAMRGRVEQFELMRDTPDRLFAYVGKHRYGTVDVHDLTVWTGHAIGWCALGRGWIDRRSGVRMYQIYAYVRGVEYTGRGQGQGVYVNLRRTKRQGVSPKR